MVVAVVRLRLHIPDNRSLKGKRAALRPILERLRSSLEASVAEVGDNDLWQSATVAVAVVANQRRHAERVTGRAVEIVEEMQDRAVLLGVSSEVVTLP
ncbi:MAG: DUF503 domain-containing protein [Candidatus Dormibacteria bacterium]